MATISEALAIAMRHHQAGRRQAAEQIYRQILQVEPENAEALSRLSLVAVQSGDYPAAVAHLARAIASHPHEAALYSNLGTVYAMMHRLDEAVDSFQQALRCQPDYAEASYNLGKVYQEQGKLTEAAGCYRRSLELKPDYVEAHNNLGIVHKLQGRLDEALACYRRALELRPGHTEAYSNYLLCRQYCPGITAAQLAAEHAQWDRRYAQPLRATWRPHANSRDPQRPLRLGFISSDFRRHPVAHFLVRTLEALGREPCETVCYCDRAKPDEMTARFEAAASLWRPVADLSDEALAEQIRADSIDVLFDLAGHTGYNRLLVFARKPAPIQITWIGYEGTTGLAAMDYILADRFEIPAGDEVHYRERVLRMPAGYVCYEPPADAPPVSPLPAAASGCVTFGSWNNPAKVGPPVIEAWAEILRRTPGARLLLKYRGWDEPLLSSRFAELFAARGVDPRRLEFLGWSSHAESLALYERIDLALDPFPFSGSATTCDALWMGVPVLTCPGQTFAGRHSLSHLSAVGLTETVAADLDQYVALAVALAHDLPRLAGLRAGLRERTAVSPLCDGPRFARDLLALLRDVWRQWTA